MKVTMSGRYQKVFLVINMSFFGDTILTDSLCRNIKKHEPDSFIVFIANKPFVDVARYMDGVDEVWCYDKRVEHHGGMGVYRFWQYYRGKYRIEASFVIYGNERGIVLSRLLGAKKVYAQRNKIFLQMFLTNGKFNYDTITHVEDMNAYLYSLYSPQPIEELRMLYRVPQEARKSVEPFLRDKKNLIAINPVTKRVEKDLRVDMVVELVDRLCAAGMTPILLGAGEGGRRYWEGLPDRTKKLLINTVDRFMIPELGAVLESCEALVTADTGTLHFACALDVPSVAVFYENEPAWIAKWAPKSIYRHRLLADGDWCAETIMKNLFDLLKEHR